MSAAARAGSRAPLAAFIGMLSVLGCGVAAARFKTYEFGCTNNQPEIPLYMAEFLVASAKRGF